MNPYIKAIGYILIMAAARIAEEIRATLINVAGTIEDTEIHKTAQDKEKK